MKRKNAWNLSKSFGFLQALQFFVNSSIVTSVFLKVVFHLETYHRFPYFKPYLHADDQKRIQKFTQKLRKISLKTWTFCFSHKLSFFSTVH